MSTYTHRYVEIQREMIDGIRWKFEKLPDPETVVGKIYKISEYNLPEGIHRYYKSEKNGEGKAEWVPLENVEKKWVPVRWYFEKSDIDQGENQYEEQYEAQRNHFKCKDRFGREIHLQEQFLWCNNGGFIRDDYIGHGWGERVFQDRGLPDDVSELVKKDIESDYHYGMTYVLLSEWEKLFEKEQEKFVSEVKKRFRDEKIEDVMDKLDELANGNRRIIEVLSKIKADVTIDWEDAVKIPKKKKKKEDDDFEWEESVDYMFEEEIWRLYLIRMEIDRCEFITEYLADGIVSSDKIRIIYYLA